MWQKSGNDSNSLPLAKEQSGNMVILRKNLRLVDATAEIPEHYEWEEWQMTAEQYEIYRNFETAINEQSDALVELAELISEVI